MQLLVMNKAIPDADPQSTVPVNIALDTDVDGTMELHIGEEDGEGLIPYTVLTVTGTRRLYEIYLALQTYLRSVHYPLD